MVSLREATVTGVERLAGSTARLRVEVDGEPAAAVAYQDLVGPVAAGDRVLLNTTAVELGLGTGGVHFVVSVLSAVPATGSPTGHAMKLRYTPAQTAVTAVEESHADALDAVVSLEGMPVVVAGLHSALAPALIGARAVDQSVRAVYVMTDAGALHAGFSDTVAALRDSGLLAATISAGQATGGDLEAITLHGALTAAKALLGAEIVVVAMGPGSLGSGSRWGFAGIEVASIADTVAAMGGRAAVVPRVSFSDQRQRHHGLSHHTITAMSLAHAPATIVFAEFPEPQRATLSAQAASLPARHTIAWVDSGPAHEALGGSDLLSSMGRGYERDPAPFRTAAAAGMWAARARRA